MHLFETPGRSLSVLWIHNKVRKTSATILYNIPWQWIEFMNVSNICWLIFNVPFLSPQKLDEYADAIKRKGAALNNCFGFIDGTVRPICRPRRDQEVVYNGHKKVHALKFQSVALPNGLIGNMFGPLEGKRHDCALLRISQLLPKLNQHAFGINGNALCLYGDPAYPLRIHLHSPYLNPITAQQKAYNKSMNQVRVSVEWLFADITNWYAFIDF